ncbi:Bacterial transcription activator, effector binding domain [compost metagenome]
MQPQIRTLSPKKLIGQRLQMSIAKNLTFELWSRFMPRRKEIENAIGSNLYSLQVYDSKLDIKDFNPSTLFDKWAAIEVSDLDNVPVEMESLELAGGLYAVFLYKGKPSDFASTFNYIFREWLPNSEFELDNNRPHFEILGEKYKNNDPDSEEEVWVPIRKKS